LTRSARGCNSISITGWASLCSRSTSQRCTHATRYPSQPPRTAVSSSSVNGGSPAYPAWLWLNTKQNSQSAVDLIHSIPSPEFSEDPLFCLLRRIHRCVSARIPRRSSCRHDRLDGRQLRTVCWVRGLLA